MSCYNIQVLMCPSEMLLCLICKPNCRLDVATRSKKLCHPAKLILLFRSVLEEYAEGHATVYTDGSKIEREVGSAFVIESASQSWTLPKAVSVYRSSSIVVRQYKIVLL